MHNSTLLGRYSSTIIIVGTKNSVRLAESEVCFTKSFSSGTEQPQTRDSISCNSCKIMENLMVLTLTELSELAEAMQVPEGWNATWLADPFSSGKLCRVLAFWTS